MTICRMALPFMALIVGGLCAAARAAHGPYHGPQCCSPLGVPCVPQRVTYGYFPTTWRSWPTAEPEIGAGQAETLPAPAQEPEAQPESPEPGPGQPLQGGPPQQDIPPQQPLRPPFDEGPAKPGLDDARPPFDDAPPLPFDDAPPGLPAAPRKSPEPFLDPTVPPEVTPSDERPGQPVPAPKDDLPPLMPDEDPFKDDPEPEISAPPAAGPKPAETTHEQRPGGLQAKADRWHVAGRVPPGKLRASDAMPISTTSEQLRAQLNGVNGEDSRSPNARWYVNPLRKTSHVTRPKTIVPAASFSGAATTRDDDRARTWRRNPLRSN